MSFDEGLWVEILKRVGVKSVCRFRCICKSWNSLISSEFFITHQLSSTNFNFSPPPPPPDNESFFLFSPGPGPGQIDGSSSYAVYKKDEFPARFRPIPFRFKGNDNRDNYHVIGVVHGIVCLTHYTKTSSTILWNPTMHKYVNIPPTIRIGIWDDHHDWPSVSRNIGFGFDGGKNMFKVVRMWTPCVNSFRVSYNNNNKFPFTPKFEVLSTRGDLQRCWRSVVADHIGPISLGEPNYGHGVFKNGAIHWVVNRHIDNTMVLVLFDCGLEEFKTMELPQELYNQFSKGEIFTYRGMLSLLVVEFFMGGGVVRDKEVWVMEEYGVATSWTKLRCDDENFVSIWEAQVSHIHEGTTKLTFEWIDRHGFKGSHHPLNAHIFEPSFLLMDAETQAMSYTINPNNKDGNIYHVVDGRQYDYIYTSERN